MKICFQFVLCVLLTGLSSSCQRSDTKASQINKLDEYLTNLHSEGLFNGAIVVSSDDEILYADGFGKANIEKDIDFTTNTTADTGSITKTFTAAAIFKLIEEGRIQLSDPLTNYLPEIPYPEIQIHHLLGHSSGIIGDGFFFEKAPSDSIITNEFFLGALTEHGPGLTFEPGTRFEYSNVNYILLAIIIEKITGQSFDSFMRSNFFGPLEMENSFLRPALFRDWPNERTVGYDFTDNTENDIADNEGFYGCCNLFFSTMDLHKWNLALMGNFILTNESLNKGLSHYKLKDASETHLNLLNWYSSNEGKSYHFTGDWRAFYTMVYRNVEQKRSIVYITNGSTPYWLRSQLVFQINQILEGNPDTNFEKPQIQTIANTDSILGAFQLEDLGTCTITKDNTNLYIQIQNNLKYSMFKVDSGIFYIPGLDAWIWFPEQKGADFQEISFSNVGGHKMGIRVKN